MSFVPALLTTLHGIAVVAIAIRLLLREDVSSAARLAWFIMVIALPAVGLVLYLLLGEVYLPRSLRKRHAVVTASLRRDLPDVFDRANAIADIPAPARPAFQLAQSINGFAALPGNRAILLGDADAAHRTLIADIDAAKESVNLLYYIWLTDRAGTEIAEALIRAADRGVTCRAMADNLGSRRLVRSELWRRLGAAGVQLQVALPLNRILGISLITRADLRNHRKLTIIDGRIAYVGSKNAADPEFAPKAKYGPWIDITLRVDGPVVNQVQALFASDWMLETDTALSAFTFAGQPHPDGFPAQFRGTGPLERRQAAAQMFCTLFETAREEIVVTTPYFVPDLTVLAAIQSASHRGVRVIVTLPRRNDSWVVQAASRGVYRGLLDAGVEIYEHGPGLLHAKIATIDGQIASLGSSNLDLRSFDLNFENDILLADPSLTAEIRDRQLAYLRQSTRVTMDEVRARPALARLKDNIIATMGPIL